VSLQASRLQAPIVVAAVVCSQCIAANCFDTTMNPNSAFGVCRGGELAGIAEVTPNRNLSSTVWISAHFQIALVAFIRTLVSDSTEILQLRLERPAQRVSKTTGIIPSYERFR
jgi:hypothetical protein